MYRYFFEISYDGTSFVGWQIQPNGLSVQESIETQLSILMQAPIHIVGCGRTDAGVHAKKYYFHADLPEKWSENYSFRLNLMLPRSIAIHKVMFVEDSAHARFDAISRSYEYSIHKEKSPFLHQFSSYIPQLKEEDFPKLQDIAPLFKEFDTFYSFCKTHSDVRTYACKIGVSRWKRVGQEWIYEITADRFLRGMVRLIVGAQLLVLKGDITEKEIRHALLNQERMSRSYSAPSQGLSLTRIEYPYISG